jgi:transcriptional regulator with XRE-family HTH domain
MKDEELSKALEARILKLREEWNISQQDLASMYNFDQSNMARIESGLTNPTFLTLHKISTALKAPLPLLLKPKLRNLLYFNFPHLVISSCRLPITDYRLLTTDY